MNWEGLKKEYPKGFVQILIPTMGGKVWKDPFLVG
jgi:hypothetical protein